MVVSLRGEQDMSTAPYVAEALSAASAAGDGDVVVDLSDVQFMDAAIITVLARRGHDLRSIGRALMLRSPSRFARRLLDLCDLVGLIDPAPADTAEIRPVVEPSASIAQTG
jgi:anti-anti-sigma factor